MLSEINHPGPRVESPSRRLQVLSSDDRIDVERRQALGPEAASDFGLQPPSRQCLFGSYRIRPNTEYGLPLQTGRAGDVREIPQSVEHVAHRLVLRAIECRLAPEVSALIVERAWAMPAI
jgi:hypothetical protein